mgnify:CR=1 FL=1
MTNSRRFDFAYRLGAGACAILAAFSSQAAAFQGAGLLRLEVSSDTLEDGPGVHVASFSSMGLQYSLTAANGVTEALAYNPGEPVIVVLGESQNSNGIHLGQVLVVNPDSVGGSVRMHEVFQPVALPTSIRSTEYFIEPAPYHTRWSIQRIVGSPVSYDFDAHVGILLNPENVVGFEAFNQVSFPTQGNQLGLVIRLPEGADATRVDFVLALNCAGHGFDTADRVGLTALALVNNVDAVADVFEAFVFDYAADHAYIRVRGSLVPGDNVILLGPEGTGEEMAHVLQKYPLDVAALAGVETGGDSPAATDCTPTAPQPPIGWFCPVEGKAPKSDDQCLAAYLAGASCKTETKLVEGPKCGGAGSSVSEQVVESGEGSISIEIPLSASANPATVTASGGYSYEKTSTTAHSFSNSNPNAPNASSPGCGTCISWYMHGLLCAQHWRYQTYDTIWANDPWDKFPIATGAECRWHSKTLKCSRSAGPSASEPCNRTGC